jgi:hypothetical protein
MLFILDEQRPAELLQHNRSAYFDPMSISALRGEAKQAADGLSGLREHVARGRLLHDDILPPGHHQPNAE